MGESSRSRRDAIKDALAESLHKQAVDDERIFSPYVAERHGDELHVDGDIDLDDLATAILALDDEDFDA